MADPGWRMFNSFFNNNDVMTSLVLLKIALVSLKIVYVLANFLNPREFRGETTPISIPIISTKSFVNNLTMS